MRIAMFGSGNLATYLGKALKNAGHEITGVYSRNQRHAKSLAKKLSSRVLLEPGEAMPDCELAILAVSDDAIAEISSVIPGSLPRVHTSGAVALGEMHGQRKGVLYPLQSFSKGSRPKFAEIPICIEASDPQLLSMLEELASTISEKVEIIHSEQRLKLHLAAVFVNNFSNHMYQSASELLAKDSLSFELLLPLIRETAAKVKRVSPHEAQTGPARRGDVKTMNKHLHLLQEDELLREIYLAISQRIMNETGYRGEAT